MILEKTAKEIHLSPQCSFKLAQVTHSISLSRVVTYYTKVFGGNAAKTSVFDVLASLFTEPGLCINTQVFLFQIFSEFDKKCIGLESYTTPLKADADQYCHPKLFVECIKSFISVD